MSAVLVESGRYAFLYGSVAAGSSSGQQQVRSSAHTRSGLVSASWATLTSCSAICWPRLCPHALQIVDMELPGGGSILGARLVEAAPTGQPASAPVWLLLLSQEHLVCYELRRPFM